MKDNPTYRTAVMNIQRYLRSIYDGSESTNVFIIPVDGIFDDMTEKALSEFQRRKKLPVTGRADRTTFDALFLEYLKNTEKTRRAEDPDFFPASPENYITEFGENSVFISVLQFALDEIRLSYDSLPTFEISGIYDADTALAVKEFQRIHRLPVTGKVNRQTWNEIARAYNLYARYAR